MEQKAKNKKLQETHIDGGAHMFTQREMFSIPGSPSIYLWIQGLLQGIPGTVDSVRFQERL